MNALESITKGNLTEAIEHLLQSQIVINDQELSKSVRLLSGGFNRLKRDNDRGTIDYDKYTIWQNKISSGLLDIASHVYQNDININLSTNTIETITILKKENDEIIEKDLNMIKEILKNVIPGFENKFPDNIHDKIFDEIRANTIFKERQSRALIFGPTNSGKTTTLNYILGAPVFPAKNELSTTKIVLCGQHKNGLIFYDTPGLDDIDEYENVTRCLLKLPEIEDSAIEKIKLLDLSDAQKEGSDLIYESLSQKDIEDEISDLNVVNKIVGRQFEKINFRDWLYEKIDFLLFIMNPEDGLKDKVKKIIANVEKNNSGKFKVFKIINIQTKPGQHNQYLSELEKVRAKYPLADQSISRLKEFGVNDADKWFCVDSKKGLGFEALLKSMADSLPPDVLHDLNVNIKDRYSNLVIDALNKRYKEFVIEIACIIGTYPVDSDVEGIDVLEFANQSLIFMAEYIYSLHSGELDDMSVFLSEKLEKLKEKRYKSRSYTRPVKRNQEVSETVVQTQSHNNVFLDAAHDLLSDFGFLESRVQTKTQTKTIEIIEKERDYYYSYGVGSIAGIELILSIGKSIIAFNNKKGNNTVKLAVDNIAKYSVTISDSYDIQNHINVASRWEHKRDEMIKKIKPLLKKYIKI